MWMADLGGYNKTERTDPDPELFMRWTEYAALSPGMEMMTAYNWDPWDYGDEALRVFRQYSVLHMSLFPYRYAAAQESARNGLPMLRSLVLMHQNDQRAREAKTEYYLGPDLLVAPVRSRVYEIYPGGDASLRDFEGRSIDRTGDSVTITGDPAHVILRWRFDAPASVTANGQRLILQGGNGRV